MKVNTELLEPSSVKAETPDVQYNGRISDNDHINNNDHISNNNYINNNDHISNNNHTSNNDHKSKNTKNIGTDYSYKHQIVWKNAIAFLLLHLLAAWGTLILISGGTSFKTFIWVAFLNFISTEGITIGSHRLYAHRSFKATPLLKAILIIFQTLSGQNSIFTWVRDHRLHHRYSDTDGDPHNSKRGFFFSHVGWLFCKKHPYVIELGKRIDMSDLQSDWMVMAQKKYFYYLYFVIAILIPVGVPYYYFGESLKISILVCYFARYVLQLNGTWLVNSAAHLYGTRPYDKKLQPVESWFISFMTCGEGWHNYHHAFPWDYKAAEISMHFNPSAKVIRLCEKLRLAYDLRTADPEMVYRRVIKTGDGTHYALGNDKDRNSVTAIGIKHPFNPSYNVVYEDPIAILDERGLPLNHNLDYFDPNVLKNNADFYL